MSHTIIYPHTPTDEDLAELVQAHHDDLMATGGREQATGEDPWDAWFAMLATA